MIACLSTSSPFTSVALLQADGAVIWAGQQEARRNASEVLLHLLQQGLDETKSELNSIRSFVSDIGPGSFTGTKVAVTAVKVFGQMLSTKVGRIYSFDLVSCKEPVYIPIRKGSFAFRSSHDQEIQIVDESALSGAVGYGISSAEEQFPNAENLSKVIDRIEWTTAFDLVPEYALPPSISTPKVPFRGQDG